MRMVVKVNILFCCILFFLFSPEQCFGQRKNKKNRPASTQDTLAVKDDLIIAKQQPFIWKDTVYYPDVHTVLLFKEGFELSNPIIKLNSDEKLTLSFDDFYSQYRQLKYTLFLCNADWSPTELVQAEYINGFTEDYIRDYKFSLNTIQHYIHYSLTFPTPDLVLTKSGNYVIRVYLDEDENEPVLVRRFMVVEPMVEVVANVKEATQIEDRNYKQEVDFIIYKQGYNITNPYSDLNVKIYQNGRQDNVIENLKPIMIKNDELDYNYDEPNVFNGGNEFRNVDIKSIKYPSQHIAKIVYDSAVFHVLLRDDIKRTFKVYVEEQDIDGRMLIKNENAYNSDIEADYVYVHFFLQMPFPFADGSLYLMGALSDWAFSLASKMQYNYERNGYEAKLYLKQGYYDYQYVFLENGKSIGDETLVEGNHRETENEYMILVYYRDPSTIYDKLIAVSYANSISSKQ